MSKEVSKENKAPLAGMELADDIVSRATEKLGKVSKNAQATVSQELLEVKGMAADFESRIKQSAEEYQGKIEKLKDANKELREKNDSLVDTNNKLFTRFNGIMDERQQEEYNKSGQIVAPSIAKIKADPMGAYLKGKGF